MSLREDILLQNLDLQQKKIRRTNEIAGGLMAEGLTVGEIADKLNFPKGADPNRILGSYAIAQTYQMNITTAYMAYPFVKEKIFGADAKDEKVVSDLYVNMRPFRITTPQTIAETAEIFAGKIKEGEEKFPSYKREKEAAPQAEYRSREFESPFTPKFDYEVTTKNEYYKRLDDKWFGKNRDKLKQAFYDDIYNAKTEDARIAARDKYYGDLITQRQNELNSFSNWEKMQEQLAKSPKTTLETKLVSIQRADALRNQWRWNVAEKITRLAGFVSDSQKVKDYADDLGKVSRAYWQSLSTPELFRQDKDNWDAMTNSFLENAPYTGMAISAAIIAPEGIPTIAAVFALSASYEGSNIEQQCLDNGFSREESRKRGWIGGTINGLIEVASGGGTKYAPSKNLFKRIASVPARITKTALAEIFREEIPQEIVSAMFSGNVPRNNDGSVNWEEVANQVMAISRDTAFASVVWSTAMSGVSKISEMDALRRSLPAEKAAQLIEVLDKFTDNVKEQAIEAGEEAAKPQITPAAAPSAQIAKTDIPITPDEEENLTAEVKSAQRYYLQFEEGDKYSVMDGDTQQEVKRGMAKKVALDYAKKLNTGEVEDTRRGARKYLPTHEEMVTLSVSDLFKFVFKKANQMISDYAKSAVAMHKDIAAYAKEQLRKLTVTEGQRDSLLSKLAQAQTDQDKAMLIDVIENIREKSRKDSAVSKHKQLRRYVNSRKKGSIHKNFLEIIGGLLEPYTMLTPKQINTAKRTLTYLKNLRESLDDFDSRWAEVMIPDKLIDSFSGLDAVKPVKDMTADEIEALNAKLKQVLHLNNLFSKLSTDRRVRETKNWLNGAIANIKILKKSKPIVRSTDKERNGLLGLHDIFLGTSKDDLTTIATKIWGLDDPITSIMFEARRKQMLAFLEIHDAIQKSMDKNGITNKDLAKWSAGQQKFLPRGLGQKIKEKLGWSVDYYDIKIEGIVRQFTMAELMSFVMHTRNRYNFKQVRENGIAFMRGILGKAAKETFRQVIDIVQSNPKAWGFINDLGQWYEKSATMMNEVSMPLFGYDIAEEENYFHLQYVPEGGVMGKQYVRDSLFDEEGRLKPRTSSKRAVVIADIFDVMMEDMNVVSSFVGLTDTIEKMRTLANYLPFREAVKNHQMTHLLKRFDELIHATQTSKMNLSDPISQLAAKVGSTVARATLINPKIWAIQISSYVLYFSETELKYLSTFRLTNGDISDALDKWTLYKYRKMGFSSSHSVASTTQSRRVMIGRGSLSEEGLTPLHGMDMITISQAARITLAEMRDDNLEGKALRWWSKYGVNPLSLKYDTKEFWKAFNDRADFLVSTTQPMFNPENKDRFSSSDNQFLRELSRFRSFVNQLLRIPTRKMALWRQGQISTREMVQDTSMSITLSAMLASIIRYIVGALLGEEKEEGELIAEMITQPLSWIPFIGYPIQRIVMSAAGQQVRQPNFSTVTTSVIDSLLTHSYEIAQGLKYSLDDERFKSGKNKGKWKSEVYFQRGIGGAMRDVLMLNGAPVRAVEQIHWFEEE